jgi:hypothetical protein
MNGRPPRPPVHNSGNSSWLTRAAAYSRGSCLDPLQIAGVMNGEGRCGPGGRVEWPVTVEVDRAGAWLVRRQAAADAGGLREARRIGASGSKPPES